MSTISRRIPINCDAYKNSNVCCVHEAEEIGKVSCVVKSSGINLLTFPETRQKPRENTERVMIIRVQNQTHRRVGRSHI